MSRAVEPSGFHPLQVRALALADPHHVQQEKQDYQEEQDQQDKQDEQDIQDNQSNPPPVGGAESVQVSQRPSDEVIEWFRAAVEEAHRLAKGSKSTPFFEFVRVVKGHPLSAGIGSSEAYRRADEILALVAKTTDPWKELLGGVAPRIEFEYAWKRVRAPAGTSPLEEAVKRARRNPASLAKRGCDDPLYNLFLNVLALLQDQKAGRPVPISTAAFGEALGVSHVTVSRMRALARDEGFLTLAKKHSFRSAGVKSRCAEYWFSTVAVPGVREEA